MHYLHGKKKRSFPAERGRGRVSAAAGSEPGSEPGSGLWAPDPGRRCVRGALAALASYRARAGEFSRPRPLGAGSQHC